MIYADYDVYQHQYDGTIIPESAWKHLALKASALIDSATFGRIERNFPEIYRTQIQFCCCEIAELLFKNEVFSDSALKHAGTKSEQVGAYAVTYTDSQQTDEKSQSDAILLLLQTYLGRTGLLYRGCDDAYESS